MSKVHPILIRIASERLLVVIGAIVLALGFAPLAQAQATPPSVDGVGEILGATPTTCREGTVGVPSGRFHMGTTRRIDSVHANGGDSEGWLRRSRPVHEVTLSAYCIDRTEVTVSAYAACVRARRCPRLPVEGGIWNAGVQGREQHPINGVSFDDATAYCQWKRQRLPTEAEWEFAARGIDGRLFPWGDAEPRDQLCWDWTSEGTTCPVGSFPNGASPFGALDMAGNVWEWTSDRWSDYAPGPARDPRIVDRRAGEIRVIRGGDRFQLASFLVSSVVRTFNGHDNRFASNGFRCAADVPRP